jgi:hypothetical protein
MVQPLDDAGEVADAVTVGVPEGPGVDLVDDATPPPRVPGRGGRDPLAQGDGVGAGCDGEADPLPLSTIPVMVA